MGKHKNRQGKSRPTPPPPQRTTSWLKKSHWKRNSAILGLVLILIVVGAFSLSGSAAGSSARPFPVLSSGWKTASLTDANGGKNFTLGDFAGKVVVLQFMAVYCQYCLAEARQLGTVQQSFSNNGQADQVVVVSVDVDPNENLARLQSYVSQYHFGAPNSNPTWYFAKDDTGQLLQSVVGTVNFSSFISQTNMYFINKDQSNTFYTMQRTAFQDANSAGDITAAAQKFF